MDFRILGRLEVLDEGRPIALGGAQPRALLALLLLHANQTLSTDRLIDELWDEHPPVTATKALQVHVSRLRKALVAGNCPGGVLVTREHGYELRVDPESLDAARFERLLQEGRGQLAASRPEHALAALEEALSLWRGAPLDEFAYRSFAQAEIARLEELQITALEQLGEAKLALGRHTELGAQLEALIREHPYREALHAQLMLALYRSDRQADALQAFQNARRTLVEELGIEPGERLRELERAILAHDAALIGPAPPQPPPTPQPRDRLPAAATRTIGRDGELRAVASLLKAGARLVTLTGPGGVGKTRLALEVASALESELPDGAWFVSLASTSSADRVTSAIGKALRVAPLQAEPVDTAIERFLTAKRGLLVLDNFEHVLAAASLVADLLAASPALMVLATSREPLHLRGEHQYAVDPLQLPADGDPAAVERAAAGTLFVERARSHDRHFELTPDNAGSIGEICRRLDGLPLAIELAAARTALLGPDGLNARLGQALNVLGTGPLDAPDRQRTLRATIDWSYRLLEASEADVFARFAVFAGGATIESAQAVTGAGLDVLEALVDKQLLRRHGSGADTRLHMLETVREYALERLDASKHAAETHGSHARHYLALAEGAEPELFTHGEAEWLARLDAEIDNLRAAFEWSLHHEPALALRLAGLLERYWDIRSAENEGLAWLDAAFDAVGDEVPIADRARARRAQVRLSQGSVYDWQGSRQHVKEGAEEALALSRETSDLTAVADALLALAALEGAATLPHPGYELADEALGLARQAGDDRLVALALMQRALAVPPGQGAQVEQAVAALSETCSPRLLAFFYSDIAYSWIKQGQPDSARPFVKRALTITRELGDPAAAAVAYGNAGMEALLSGDLERAQAAFDQQLLLSRERGFWVAAEGLAGLAAIATRRGELGHAAELLGAATAVGPWDGDADVGAWLEQDFFGPARRRHGSRLWEETVATGAQLSFEDAIALGIPPAERIAKSPSSTGSNACS
jgi:predicted ATPase/DNA-binding SARP family transcriptional activator